MNYRRLGFSLIITQLAGIVGSFFTTSAIPTWYATLEKPFFNPPNWLFGPVWVLLYGMMGVSIYLIWQQLAKNQNAGKAMLLFWIHLFFNATWSIIFFGMQNLSLAFLNIAIIWVFILVLIKQFYSINKIASYLLIPYLLWVTFASLLNYSIWQLN